MRTETAIEHCTEVHVLETLVHANMTRASSDKIENNACEKETLTTVMHWLAREVGTDITINDTTRRRLRSVLKEKGFRFVREEAVPAGKVEKVCFHVRVKTTKVFHQVK